MKEIFFSQQGEDFFVYQNFINNRVEDGIFLETGACDGNLYSNTWFFEKYLKFTGVLIEPSRHFFQKLIKNRMGCKCLNLAISEKEGEAIMIGDRATGGLKDCMSESFKNNWHKNSSNFKVKTRPLNKILDDENITYIDFFSLDVEGGELVVLKSIDWKNIEIYLFCIELDGHNKEKDEECRNILRNNGFIFRERMCINEFWENPSYSRKNKLYNKSNKIIFSGDLREHGKHCYLERHCIPEINRVLGSWEKRKAIRD